jgi:hypothetical protein
MLLYLTGFVGNETVGARDYEGKTQPPADGGERWRMLETSGSGAEKHFCPASVFRPFDARKDLTMRDKVCLLMDTLRAATACSCQKCPQRSKV